jgi:predicted secreted protein
MALDADQSKRMEWQVKPGSMQPSFSEMRHMFRSAIASIALPLLVVLLEPRAIQAAEQSMKLALGERATVQLDENPTTGYRWQIDRTKSDNLAIVRIDDLGFFAREEGSARVGASGTHRWSIEGVSAGQARIVFEYLRPWEKAAVRRHEISVEVTGQ